MGLLDDLKKQADDLKAKDTDRTAVPQHLGSSSLPKNGNVSRTFARCFSFYSPASMRFRVTRRHKLSDHLQLRLPGNRVRLYKLMPLDLQARRLKSFHLLTRGRERHHRVERAMRHEQTLLLPHRRKFRQQFFRLQDVTTNPHHARQPMRE